MDSFDFCAAVFHPDTERNIIRLRDSLLEKECRDFFPLFPLYAELEDGFFENSSAQEKQTFKNSAQKCTACRIFSKFLFDGILFFGGEAEFLNTDTDATETNVKKQFVIPAAVKKNTDGKTLTSVFKTAKAALKNRPAASEIPEMRFKSFQLAHCVISENQYKLYETVWLKVIS